MRTEQGATARLRIQLGLWYTLAIGSLGALHPLLATSLGRDGVPPATVAAMLTVFPLGVLLAGPVVGWLADRGGAPLPWLRAAAAGAALAAAALAATSAIAPLWAAMIALALLRAPMFPLIDALTLDLLGDARARYGTLRAWGSVGFIVMVNAGSALLVVSAAAPRAVTALCLAGCAVLAWVVPAPSAEAVAALRPGAGGPAIRALWPLWLVGAGIGMATAMYDFLFVTHLEALGGTPALAARGIGAGVGLEVTLMATSGRWLPRLRPERALLLAAAVGTVRWALTATARDPALATAVQVLHGVSFGAFWVAAIGLIGERLPPLQRAAATGALLATTAGLGPLLALVTASWLLPRAGSASVFVVSTVVAAGATTLAWWQRRALAGERGGG